MVGYTASVEQFGGTFAEGMRFTDPRVQVLLSTLRVFRLLPVASPTAGLVA